jgi:hypothetical protein
MKQKFHNLNTKLIIWNIKGLYATYAQSCSIYTCNPYFGLSCGASGCGCPTGLSGNIFS